MPKWGLTPEQRATEPWGLPADRLRYAKTVTDPVHRDVYLTRLEVAFLDSAPLQRLRRVHQLGSTHLVYPGATHSRFAHSLGTLRAAQDLLDAVLTQQHTVADLFAEWQSLGADEYNRRVAEATVLARLGALLHDVCHVPFGHSIEDELGILVPHDQNGPRLERLWMMLDTELRDVITPQLKLHLERIILSAAGEDRSEDPTDDLYPFVRDIVGNTICADLLDYLQRDHLSTGLPARLGHRFIDGFYVTPSTHQFRPRHMALLIRKGDHVREDMVSELFKYLRYRYELSERVLFHHTKLAADTMVGKALEMWYDALRAEEAAKVGRRSSTSRADDIDVLLDKTDRDKVSQLARERMEAELLRMGDDGLLEYLAVYGEGDGDRRRAAVRQLAADLLTRKLYKRAGVSDSDTRAMAEDLYRGHGSFEARRRLEEQCARYVGLAHRWHVLLWIPKPQMKMKAAEVLVDDGHRVLELETFDTHGAKRGTEIYDSHQALWSVRVFVHRSVDEEQRAVIRAFLHERTGISWSPEETRDQPTELGRLAARRVARELDLRRENEDTLALDPAAYTKAAERDEQTFEALVARLLQIGRARYQTSTAGGTPVSGNGANEGGKPASNQEAFDL